jgi:hypothetical protein
MRLLLFLFIFAPVLVGCSLPGGAQLGKDNTESVPTENEKVDSPTGIDSIMEEIQGSKPGILLENLGPAPELSNETWINSPAPLRLADLRGKVVLLEMWTFG